MYICYLDESGCTGVLPHAESEVQPLFVPGAVILRQSFLHFVTQRYLDAKRRFFPGLFLGESHRLSAILKEVKGSELRRAICAEGRNKVRQTQGFLDEVLRLLEAAEAKILGRVLVKGLGVPIEGRSVYTSSVQAIFAHFQRFLAERGATGLVIADSRSKAKNANLSHSIFTQKFSSRGDRYDRILEMPSFGHSENHVGLQLADLLCSAFLFPMAAQCYCEGHVRSIHVNPRFRRLHERYGTRLKRLQYLYRDEARRTRGGITVDDRLGQRPSRLLFAVPSGEQEVLEELAVAPPSVEGVETGVLAPTTAARLTPLETPPPPVGP